MTIIATGGTIANRASTLDPIMPIRADEARVAFWRDFLNGLTFDERLLFDLVQLPNGGGRLVLSRPRGVAAWTAVQANPASSGVHPHVQAWMRDPDRAVFIMPAPVFQLQRPGHHWVSEIASRQNSTGAAMVIGILGYGLFPTEWLGYEVLGRTHRMSPERNDACLYATRFLPSPLAPEALHGWRSGRQRFRFPGDGPQRWVDRASCIALYHEVLQHALRYVRGNAGPYDEWGAPRPQQLELRQPMTSQVTSSTQSHADAPVVLGPVSIALEKELRRRVQHHGVVVWLDLDEHSRPIGRTRRPGPRSRG